MKSLRSILMLFGFLVTISLSAPNNAQAQCAMCSLNAENSTQHGNEMGKGLNNGIFFLLAMPFIIGGGITLLWYKKFRNKEEKSPLL